MDKIQDGSDQLKQLRKKRAKQKYKKYNSTQNGIQRKKNYERSTEAKQRKRRYKNKKKINNKNHDQQHQALDIDRQSNLQREELKRQPNLDEIWDFQQQFHQAILDQENIQPFNFRQFQDQLETILQCQNSQHQQTLNIQIQGFRQIPRNSSPVYYQIQQQNQNYVPPIAEHQALENSHEKNFDQWSISSISQRVSPVEFQDVVQLLEVVKQKRIRRESVDDFQLDPKDPILTQSLRKEYQTIIQNDEKLWTQNQNQEKKKFSDKKLIQKKQKKRQWDSKTTQMRRQEIKQKQKQLQKQPHWQKVKKLLHQKTESLKKKHKQREQKKQYEMDAADSRRWKIEPQDQSKSPKWDRY